MAVVASGTIIAQGTEQGARWALISLRKITAGDTIDVSAVPQAGLFTTVWGAYFVATTNRTATPTVSGISGTTLTLAGVGLAADGGLLLVVGEY